MRAAIDGEPVVLDSPLGPSRCRRRYACFSRETPSDDDTTPDTRGGPCPVLGDPHELDRVELLAGLPGQTLVVLAKRMEREEIAPGTAVSARASDGRPLLRRLRRHAQVTNSAMGERGMLRPGDYFGEVALAMDMPRTATVTAITPAVVASCDRETFDEFLRPLFADD